MTACADTTPSPARIENLLLGGSDYTAADLEIARSLARALGEDHPVLSGLHLQNRRFLDRAVRRLAQEGITRFLDLGCGLPVRLRDGTRLPMIHEAARDAGADPWVIYVDHDPLVVSHVSAAVAGIPGITVVKADLGDPRSVMIREHLRDMTWDGPPVAVVFGSVLHYWNREKAQAIVNRYVPELPPGSAVVISVARLGEHAAAERRALLPGIPFHNHDEQAVESFFGSLQYWPLLGAEGSTAARIIGGIGIVP